MIVLLGLLWEVFWVTFVIYALGLDMSDYF